MGRPPSDKTFANMLRIAISEAHAEGGTKLRAVADALVTKAITGDVPAIKEIADRLDGKVPQAVVGDDNEDPISLRHELDADRFVKSLQSLVARADAEESK
ncbi:MAG: hypothetical protein JWR51_4724 [Devosia sp.]|uniref:hypothetical protein n=1 Tax=Devosia sp. TaxID=1871048 RepID=UPI002619E064|nr:hypothetical protein [Devosia sp.]MDB5531621.1 hypothetical protein [Devosia sp.]